jgi:hypothetical protein
MAIRSGHVVEAWRDTGRSKTSAGDSLLHPLVGYMLKNNLIFHYLGDLIFCKLDFP